MTSLQQKKHRDSQKKFIAEGVKIVKELLDQDRFSIDGIYFTSELEFSIPEGVNSTEISHKELERISNLKTPNKTLAIVNYRQDLNSTEDEFQTTLKGPVIVLEDIQNPNNLGSIIRTADWFGISTLFVSSNTVDVFNSKVIQASMGAILRTNIFYGNIVEYLKKLKENGFSLIGATLQGSDLYSFDLPEKSALLMGSESLGISERHLAYLDHKVSIPQFGKSESLNVAMAAGIFLSEYRRQFG
ncbi:RNA methyltransferase [Crocinitomix catalasitica]|nr:RNA methyltransferase [Crocinitomix catalasitica]